MPARSIASHCCNDNSKWMDWEFNRNEVVKATVPFFTFQCSHPSRYTTNKWNAFARKRQSNDEVRNVKACNAKTGFV